MSGFRLFTNLIGITCGKFCRQIILPAGLAVLCLFLSFAAGRGAEESLGGGVSFSGLTLAVTAEDDDSVPRLLEEVLGRMADVRSYCTVRAMDCEAAERALREGEVTAVLILPKNFVGGVQSGENPDVRVVVSGALPLEAALTLWVGQSAADLLSAVQSGIYAVIDAYDAAPPEGFDRDRMILGINMEYIRWTLDRESIFEEEKILPTESLPVSLHYALCLLAFFLLGMAPMTAWNYGGGWLAYQRRLGFAARSPLWGYFASLVCSTVILTAVIFPGLVLAAAMRPLSALGAASAFAAAASVFGACCALLTGSTAACGALSFVFALLALFAAGGIVPPVMLPEGVRVLSFLSPVAWMRDTAAAALGYDIPGAARIILPLGTAVFGAAGAALYVRRVRRVVRGA